MGGGRRYFLPNTTMDPETNTVDKNQRQDGLDLIKVFLGAIYLYIADPFLKNHIQNYTVSNCGLDV